MIVLALDTTTREGSVALLDGGRIVDERLGDSSRSHAERLPSEIVALLAANGRAIGDVDLFVVASGPGSFTGLRIGIATMQGLAFVRQRPLVGVSALDAIAFQAAPELAVGWRLGVWTDAYRREVFAALYERRPDEDVAVASTGDLDHLKQVEGPTVGAPAATLSRWAAAGVSPTVLAGQGALLYQDVIVAGVFGARVVDVLPLAGTLGLIGAARVRRDPVGALGVQPLYIRRPDAEVAREHARADRASELTRPD